MSPVTAGAGEDLKDAVKFSPASLAALHLTTVTCP